MSKRKKKKQQKKLAAQQQAASATAIGNPEDVQTKGDEPAASDDSKKAAEKPSNKKPDNKKVENKRPEPKTIIGFGMKEKSNIIHAISNVDNSALCDIRIKGIEIDSTLEATDVNCKSCPRYSTFKQLLITTTGHEPAEKAAKKVEDEGGLKPAKKPAPKKGKKPTLEELAAANGSSEIHVLKQLMYQAIRRAEARMMKKLVEYVDEAIREKPVFIIGRDKKGKKDIFYIMHFPSRLTLVKGLSLDEAEMLLPLLMDIPYKWDGMSAMPQEWMAGVRTAVDKIPLKSPRKLKRRKIKAVKPTKRKLKRRKKDEPRRIKRRSRH